MDLIQKITHNIELVTPINSDIQKNNIKKVEIARRLKITPQQLNNILSGRTGVSSLMEERLKNAVDYLKHRI